MTCSFPPSRLARRTAATGLLALALAAGAPAAAQAAPTPTPPAARTVAAAVQQVTADAQDRRAEAAFPLTAEAVVGSFLERGQTLAPGDALASPSGQYSLIMDPDGSVLLQKAANRLAEAYAQALFVGVEGSRLLMQTDGNVVLYGPDDVVYGSLDTGGTTGDRLVIQDDGNLVLYGTGGEVVFDFDTGDPEFLSAGGTLLPGERLTSEDTGTSLLMQDDGNLVLYTLGVARFQTGTGTPGAAAVLQSDGNFVVYSPSSEPLFNTGTSRRSEFDVLLVTDREFRVLGVDVDANAETLGVFSSFGSAWGTDVVESGMVLLPGDRRNAAGGIQLLMQTDGNLVQYVNGTPRFRTRTEADIAIMQTDGNFVLYQFGEQVDDFVPVFNTRTGRFPGSRLVVQSDENVVVYTPDNRAVFASRR